MVTLDISVDPSTRLLKLLVYVCVSMCIMYHDGLAEILVNGGATQGREVDTMEGGLVPER